MTVHSRMTTTDGIAAGDWKEVEGLARAVAEAAFGDDTVLYTHAVDELFGRLRILESRYGPLPSILATMADYTKDDREALDLLENAFFVSEHRNDAANMTYIASSIAQRYVEDLCDLAKGKEWVDRLRRCLLAFPDHTEREVLAELDARLDRE